MHYKQQNKYDPTQREREGDGKKTGGVVWNTEKENERERERNTERLREEVKK